MNSKKQPNELSNLLKENNNHQIIFQKIINKGTFKKNKIIVIMNFINENFLLLLFILLFFTLIMLLIENKSKKEIIIFNKNEIKDIYLNENISYTNIITYKKLNISNLYNNKKICSENNSFAILTRKNCQACGLFSYYIVHLGCIITFLNEGYIPIIDVGSFTNIFNGYKEKFICNNNSWENFFNQPCDYKLNDIKKYKNNIKYFECECTENMPSEKIIYSNETLLKFYRDIAEKYMSVKKEILNEVKIIWKSLFKNSKNVLGILIRGTDYITLKPATHSIPPNDKMIINDTKKLDLKNKYDYLFLATEDIIIRNKFIKKFGKKLKYLIPGKNIEYNYNKKNFLSFHKNVFGNMKFQKTYLLSMIILSKCIDIISARTSGAAGAFILSKGFRNKFIYYLGEY